MNYGPTPGSDEDLKTIFRSQELRRRNARMALMKNHIELSNEHLTDEERELDRQVRAKLIQEQLKLEESMTPGYWRRLWSAIRGKRHE
jgi:hypothetical protein